MMEGIIKLLMLLAHMKYHPHGDASIGDAMIQIGQKISIRYARKLG